MPAPPVASPDPEQGSIHDVAWRVEVGDLMVVLGDSIAAGIGAGHVSGGCMAQVAATLSEHHPDISMANFAIPSEDSASLLARGGQLDRAIEAIALAHERGERVGPVTLSMGANDSIEAATLGEDEALHRFATNLDSALLRLAGALERQESALGDVVCVQTFYNPFVACGTDPALPTADQLAPRRSRRNDFNTVIRAAATRHAVALVDIAAVFRGREIELTWLRSGDIHPNAEGQRAIRDAFVSAIRAQSRTDRTDRLSARCP